MRIEVRWSLWSDQPDHHGNAIAATMDTKLRWSSRTAAWQRCTWVVRQYPAPMDGHVFPYYKDHKFVELGMVGRALVYGIAAADCCILTPTIIFPWQFLSHDTWNVEASLPGLTDTQGSFPLLHHSLHILTCLWYVRISLVPVFPHRKMQPKIIPMIERYSQNSW